MQQKITMDDIRRIKPGTSVTFYPSERKKIQSIRNMASFIGGQEPELGVKYSCSANYSKCEIRVTAVPTNKKLKK